VRKYLFLDIDGVLNNNATWTRCSHASNFTGVDPVLRDRYLAWRDRRPQVSVVLSSAWRHADAWMDELKRNGIHWISTTPDNNTLSGRHTEIYQWFRDRNVDHTKVHWAVLDDMSVKVGKHLVQTSMRHGLRLKHLHRVDRLLEID